MNTDNFPIDKLIEFICIEYGITTDEFHSDFSYGSLSQASKLFLLSLALSGVRNKEISKLTGFSPPRVFYLLKTAKNALKSDPYFSVRLQGAIDMIKKLDKK